ncbi:MAG: hypothetical protein K8T20_12625, partial [Planctomycetes bacterium]|nr:hypothetical protein [Planctomycetota bacterium]
GLQFYQGYILGVLANHLMKQGHPHRAELAFRESIDALRDLEEAARTGNMFCMRALCLVALGKRFEAAPLWNEGAALLRRESAEQLLDRRKGEMLKACAKAGVRPLE